VRVLALVILLAGVWISRASATTGPTPPPAEPPLPIHAAFVLGVVEGVTEFLPISSTGHLIIAAELLGLEEATPRYGPDGKRVWHELGGHAVPARPEALRGPDGEVLWHRRPGGAHPEGIPLTRKRAVDSYLVVIQAGAILAVLLVCGAEVRSMLRGLIGQSAAGRTLLRNVALAVAPVVIAGLLLGPWIEAHLFSAGTVAAALAVGAVLMLAAERRRRSHPPVASRTGADLSAGQALGIGFAQCLALWPGMSRAMVTIVGGYACGLAPARAAEFSFLVGLPVLAGAALYKGVQTGPAMVAGLGWTPVLVGAITAAFSAAVAVRFLLRHLSRHGLTAFALYRLALAGVIAWWFAA